jgi:hypothetical protein
MLLQHAMDWIFWIEPTSAALSGCKGLIARDNVIPGTRISFAAQTK